MFAFEKLPKRCCKGSIYSPIEALSSIVPALNETQQTLVARILTEMAEDMSCLIFFSKIFRRKHADESQKKKAT